LKKNNNKIIIFFKNAFKMQKQTGLKCTLLLIVRSLKEKKCFSSIVIKPGMRVDLPRGRVTRVDPGQPEKIKKHLRF
jgi:hypothetical protein